MSAGLVRLLVVAALAGASGCAVLGLSPATTSDLPVDARCMLRVWDPANPADASSQADIWGTIASVDAEKIILVEADSEPVAGKPLLEDPKQIPLAIWVGRMRIHGTHKYSVRRDQVLAAEVLDAARLKQVLTSYTRGTRCNVRVCDVNHPHDPAFYRDLWGTIGRSNNLGVELTDARDEQITVLPPPASNRLASDAVRDAHLHSSGQTKFRITPERIISIQWLEAPLEHHAQSSGWDFKAPF